MSSGCNAAEWKHLRSMIKNILFTWMRIIRFFIYFKPGKRKEDYLFSLQNKL